MIPSNSEDIIDSRDIIERIQELRDLRDAAKDEGGSDWTEWLEGDEREELDILLDLAGQAESTPDWEFGEALIRDSYFEDYARQLAEGLGAIDPNASWPMTCIDWEQAANDLKMDYFSVDFDDVTYWIRA